ncbi:acyltransferase family protein [Amycolatopsis keratiniphila]|uniref:acyltransferase family protein n=1 Tax=Amycolatopsis keratiniphila TaxID=129921 RepID=UPI00087B747B|nr:acyltransferase [Amycolatopsis keratiniphila]OLZ47251.1 acyltransferase [Amycolatopsis keratiniphila subsp. nogabecina]SDU38730.1 Peptidoglycan/LPS O-acetylase OafA/YrhL, contains acyltransferase and SGNH-hydrolase domains [Amycolatopsis keratiniphila]
MTDTQPVARRRPHLPALDGLRGVAVVAVLLFHTGRLPGGFLGVDLFFALSGYLITGLLLREVEARGGISLPAFWGRRLRRLQPALAVVLVVVTAVVWSSGAPDLVRTTLSDGPWVQLNVVNWHLLADSAGYWDRFGASRVFEHLWSIAVEEQFYLVWPVLVLVVARGVEAERRVMVTALAGSVLSVALMVALFDPADPSRVYTGTDTRAFSLLLGAVVATEPVRAMLARTSRAVAGRLSVAVVAALGVLWSLADGVNSPWLFTGGLFAHSLLAAVLIGLCVHNGRSAVARVLSWRPVRWLGGVSYSLYLWHWPVCVVLSPAMTGLRGWWWTALVFAVSTGLAALSKYLVEDPIRFRVRWVTGRRGGWAFGALMAGLAVLWLGLPAPAPVTVDLTGL